MIIFDADDPLVLDGTYDREGYTAKERRALARKVKCPHCSNDDSRLLDVREIWVFCRVCAKEFMRVDTSATAQRLRVRPV